MVGDQGPKRAGSDQSIKVFVSGVGGAIADNVGVTATALELGWFYNFRGAFQVLEVHLLHGDTPVDQISGNRLASSG